METTAAAATANSRRPIKRKKMPFVRFTNESHFATKNACACSVPRYGGGGGATLTHHRDHHPYLFPCRYLKYLCTDANGTGENGFFFIRSPRESYFMRFCACCAPECTSALVLHVGTFDSTFEISCERKTSLNRHHFVFNST